ncbi:MAG: LacI family DNA-binding transcriptional regulator [Planctomycetaceae bacterium]
MSKPAGKPRSGVPRMIDIAAQAGVSRMAVSAVLMGTGNGNISVSPETAARIRDIAAELNYRPNVAAQMLAGRRSNVIALVAATLKDNLTQAALCWLHEAAEDHGYRILTATGENETTDRFQHLIRDVHSGWVAGLVYLAFGNEAQWPAMAQLLAGVPNCVAAFGDLSHLGIPSVATDYAEGVRLVVRRLADQQRRRIVFLAEEDQSASMRLRLDAFSQTMQERGLECDSEQVIVATGGWVMGDPAYTAEFDGLAQRVMRLNADAVICDSDFTAAEMVNAFRRSGVGVPAQMAVIGWGNSIVTNATDPTITTVSYNLPVLLARVVSRFERMTSELRQSQQGRVVPSVEFVAPLITERRSG